MTTPLSTPGAAEKLAPCPFCGGEARLSKYQDESLWSHAIVWWASVKCDECDAERGSECEDPDGAKAIAAWNERALASRSPSPVGDAEHRAWALANVERAKERTPTCACWPSDPNPVFCVQCAHELGRRLGHVEAGAYFTHEEVFAALSPRPEEPGRD